MEQRKRMLIIAHNMSPTGVPAVYMSIVRSLNDKYVFDIVLGSDNNTYYQSEFLNYGGSIFVNKAVKPSNIFKKIWWFLFSYNRETNKFIKNNLNFSDYVAVHSFNEIFSYPFFKSAKKSGVKKMVLYLLSASRAYKLKRNFKTLFVEIYRKKALRLCSSIACISKETLKYNNYKNKGIVFYPSIKTSKIGPIVKCQHNRLVLSQIASFSERKNQLFTLEVLRLIKESVSNVKLLFVGQRLGTEYEKKMDDFIICNNLCGNVEFLGPDLEKCKLNEIASYTLYPSTMESFGLVIIDSQTSGIHCFASNTLPDDTDLGNVDYLALDPKVWCNKILRFYQKYGNKRTKPTGIQKFSEENFKETLLKICI